MVTRDIINDEVQGHRLALAMPRALVVAVKGEANIAYLKLCPVTNIPYGLQVKDGFVEPQATFEVADEYDYWS